MSYIADLHLHSRFSQAVSKFMTLDVLAQGAKTKGIQVLGTGDCLHPQWLQELKELLRDQENGFFEYQKIQFVLTTEVSLIYSDKVGLRRVHILIFFPNFESVDKVIQKLQIRKVNLAYDGRPVMGLSTVQLCQIVFDCSPEALIIPAHVWTPWFGMYGSKSGYDHLEDCFGQFSKEIFAIETGLSSEPQMNWRIPELDTKAIVSFSDAHSVKNLGREVTEFKGEMTFQWLRDDIKNHQISKTIEFFPEEGKYHLSGHRICGVVYDNQQLKERGSICPVCKKPLTIGVMQRVEELASRSDEDLGLTKHGNQILSSTFPKRPQFVMLVGLSKIISESIGVGVASKKVQKIYDEMIHQLGDELTILEKTPLNDVKQVAGEKIAQGIDHTRRGNISIIPGFDNTYGKVTIF